MRERCREQKEGQEVKLGLVSKKKKIELKKKETTCLLSIRSLEEESVS